MINMNEFRLRQFILIKLIKLCEAIVNFVFDQFSFPGKRIFFLVTFRSLAIYTRYARAT